MFGMAGAAAVEDRKCFVVALDVESSSNLVSSAAVEEEVGVDIDDRM